MADDWEEMFDVVNAENNVVGQKSRKECHKDGHLHRAVHVLIFNPAGELLLQRRSAGKAIAPSLLDLSCAEHNSVGEDFQTAAVRGMGEELGITTATVQDLTLIRPVYHHCGRFPEIGLIDNELLSLYSTVLSLSGPIQHDPKEVQETSFVAVEQLLKDVEGSPEKFTPWFLLELANIDLVAVREQTLAAFSQRQEQHQQQA